MQRIVSKSVTAALLLGAPVPVLAQTVAFGGTVAAGSPFAADSTYAGSFTYNGAAAARAGSDATSAEYDSLTSFILKVTSGGTTYTYTSASPSEVQIGNQGATGSSMETTDRFALVERASDGLGSSTSGAPTLYSFILRLDDATGTVFAAANGGVPGALNLSSFQSATAFFFSSPTALELGTVTSFATVATATPEPATWAMMVAGFGLVGGALRTRRRVTVAYA